MERAEPESDVGAPATMVAAEPGEPASPQPLEQPEAPAPDRIEPGMSSGEAAFAVLRAQYAAVRAEESAVATTDDAEARHRMRVAIRRLRAALAVFEPALPARAAVHRERFDRIGTVLGAVRDLDVLKARVVEWMHGGGAVDLVVSEGLIALIEERRGQARRRAIAELARERTGRTLASFERFLARGPVKRSRQARAPILDLAPELLEKEYGRLLEAGDQAGPDAPDELLHALRIRCKRLRYTVEFFEPLYGKPARRYLRRLTAAQDLLGAHHDAVTIGAALRAIALDPRRRRAARTVLAIGALVERSAETARQTRESLPSRYGKVTGRRWRRLMEAAENAREKRPND